MNRKNYKVTTSIRLLETLFDRIVRGYASILCERVSIECSAHHSQQCINTNASQIDIDSIINIDHDGFVLFYRINVILSNSLELTEEFDCPIGWPMNLINKCSIW